MHYKIKYSKLKQSIRYLQENKTETVHVGYLNTPPPKPQDTIDSPTPLAHRVSSPPPVW